MQRPVATRSQVACDRLQAPVLAFPAPPQLLDLAGGGVGDRHGWTPIDVACRRHPQRPVHWRFSPIPGLAQHVPPAPRRAGTDAARGGAGHPSATLIRHALPQGLRQRLPFPRCGPPRARAARAARPAGGSRPLLRPDPRAGSSRSRPSPWSSRRCRASWAGSPWSSGPGASRRPSSGSWCSARSRPSSATAGWRRPSRTSGASRAVWSWLLTGLFGVWNTIHGWVFVAALPCDAGRAGDDRIPSSPSRSWRPARRSRSACSPGPPVTARSTCRRCCRTRSGAACPPSRSSCSVW